MAGESNGKKDIFLATLAHELRNALAPIRNVGVILKSLSAECPKVKWCSEVIERQVGQLSHLLDDLLDISRITQGRLNLQITSCEISSVVAQAVEEVRPQMDASHHELAVSLPDEQLFARVDRCRLVQILSSILDNAAKFTEKGGKISLTVEAAVDEVKFTIRDNGVGIPTAHLARVFDMFCKVGEDRSRGGLGIGLSLAKGLVEMHHGTIGVRSGNQGSEFIVCLPIESA